MTGKIKTFLYKFRQGYPWVTLIRAKRELGRVGNVLFFALMLVTHMFNL